MRRPTLSACRCDPNTVTMTASEMPEGIENLSASQCWERFRSTDLDRLAVTAAGHPEIFPINYVVDHGCLVFRTAAGTKLDAALAGGSVAMETDGYNPSTKMAWSVVAKGPVERLVSIDDVISSASCRCFPGRAGKG